MNSVGVRWPSAVWPALIIVDAPRFDLRLGVGHRGELLHVQTFVPYSPVERLDERVLHGFAGADEVEEHTAVIRPVFERPRLELRAVIHRDRARVGEAPSTRSKAAPTVCPDILDATSSNGLERLH